MKLATMNEYSLVPATLMPTAAAARSLARTASIRKPVGVLVRLPTDRPTRASRTRTTTPNQGLGKSWTLLVLMSRLRPKRVSLGTLLPTKPPLTAVLLKNSESIVTAAATVTTARLTPRARCAGRPMSVPRTVPARPAMMMSSGNGTPALAARWLMVNPPTPPVASWQSEIWPLNPVSTTKLRQMNPQTRLTSRPYLKLPDRVNRPIRPTTTQPAVMIP